MSREYRVVRTSEAGALVLIDGDNRWIGWSDLSAACQQEDAELAAEYRSINRRARAMAADGPVVVSVNQDHTNVWWVASVRALHGGGEAAYPRCRDEGGTLPNHMLAACEAEDICQRLGSRVARRDGFDGLAAKARAAKICGR